MSAIDHRHMTKHDREAVAKAHEALNRLLRVFMQGGMEGHQIVGALVFTVCTFTEHLISTIREMESQLQPDKAVGKSIPELVEIQASVTYHTQKLDAVVPWAEGAVAKFALEQFGYNPGYRFKRGEYQETVGPDGLTAEELAPALCPEHGVPIDLGGCKCPVCGWSPDTPKN